MAEPFSDFISTFYKGTPFGSPINTTGTNSFSAKGAGLSSIIDAVNPINADRLGLGAGNGEPASGKSFSELSGGKGWGGILGVLGILGANMAGEPEAAEAIVDAGPQGVETAVAAPVGNMIEGIEGTFARIAIIILGFIFVAVGLSMFKPGQIVQAASAAL